MRLVEWQVSLERAGDCGPQILNCGLVSLGVSALGLAISTLFFFVFLPFLGLLPRHMEVPRPGVELEL